jgi:hypothetical protein
VDASLNQELWWETFLVIPMTGDILGTQWAGAWDTTFRGVTSNENCTTPLPKRKTKLGAYTAWSLISVLIINKSNQNIVLV